MPPLEQLNHRKEEIQKKKLYDILVMQETMCLMQTEVSCRYNHCRYDAAQAISYNGKTVLWPMEAVDEWIRGRAWGRTVVDV